MAITRVERGKKSEKDQDPRVQQIDNLQYLATQNRDQFLGPNFLKTCEDLFNLATDSGQRPSFRPAVSVPQLQLLNLNEATDLASIRPKVFIIKNNERDKQREEAFQDAWRYQHCNVTLLKAAIWSLYAGTGFLQVGFDPWARRGRGEVYLEWRSPREVCPDHSAKEWKDWSYVVVEDRLYLDEVRARFPGPGQLVRPRAASSGAPYPSNATPGSGYSFSMPPGPLSTMPIANAMARNSQGWDGTVRVRTLFVEDYGVEEVKSDDKDVNAILETLTETDNYGKRMIKKLRRKFPNKRMMVECEGVILADGDNYGPNRTIPVFPLYSLPNLTNTWAPPPTKISVGLQDLAGQMYSQAIENVVRLNNGVWFIHEDTGIDAEDFGALPAEIRIINAGSPVPEVKWPAPMPPHMIQIPGMLLSLQKELQGFTKERQGDSGSGNVGAGVFDSALFQSQFMTRMRSMLLSQTAEDVVVCMFFMMGELYQGPGQYFPSFGDEFTRSKWEPVSNEMLKEYEMYLDHASIRPVSQAAMAKSVFAMRQAGMIDTEASLEELEVPDAVERAKAAQHEQELAALSKLKRR